MQQNLRSFTSREAYIPRLTSRDISERAKLEKLELETRMWRCPCCQKVNDRDANAAINIKFNAVPPDVAEWLYDLRQAPVIL